MSRHRPRPATLPASSPTLPRSTGAQTSLPALLSAAALIAFTGSAGCGNSPSTMMTMSPDAGTPVGAIALYDNTSTRDDFFALPWPMDSRKSSDGKFLDLTGFYQAAGEVGKYVTAVAAEPLGGFGTSSAIYFRFDAPLDPTTLPDGPATSITDGATAFVVDVTTGSPTFGKRAPVRPQFTALDGNYIGANWLALLPEPGFPLRERTTYAAVITDGVHAADGGPVRRDSRFDPSSLPALGVDVSHVMVATVFTTQDVTTIMKQLRAAVHAQAPAPVAADLKWVAQVKSVYDQYEGTYMSPNYQEGDVPYSTSGGHIHLGSDGLPAVVRTENLRFAMTIPQGTMPAAGWPVALYAHGTGGSFVDFVEDGSAQSAANAVDAAGNTIDKLAMISIDQVLHGPRDPTMSNPDLTFFNFLNIVAARDNPKQGALDDFQLMRLVESMNIAAAPMTNAPIKFDATKIYFKGHSQGGLTGPLFLAYEPDVKAAVLSGAGANLVLALLSKTEPVDVASLAQSLVAEPVDEFHPLLNLLQAYLESSDPGNYARLFFREPPDAQAPKSIYQSVGLVDHYAPVPGLKAFGLAMGLQPVNPDLDPIDDFALLGLSFVDAPVMANEPGMATGVLCEYKVPLGSDGQPLYDGHFVVFDNRTAVRQSNAFLATHAATGIATLQP